MFIYQLSNVEATFLGPYKVYIENTKWRLWNSLAIQLKMAVNARACSPVSQSGASMCQTGMGGRTKRARMKYWRM